MRISNVPTKSKRRLERIEMKKKATKERKATASGSTFDSFLEQEEFAMKLMPLR
jgi:hypothetical protein